ncbi:MAG: hypothetical protein HOV87_22350 [Catenulispora sp.]|nr:hypothetical protein [Catenulispora sp.]
MIAALEDAGLEVDPVELADALWLAAYSDTTLARGDSAVRGSIRRPVEPATSAAAEAGSESGTRAAEGVAAHRAVEAEAGTEAEASSAAVVEEGVAAASSGVSSTGSRRRLVRDLKPLRRKVPHGPGTSLDERATAELSAAVGAVTPVLRPRLEPCFDVHLTADASGIMPLWEPERASLSAALARSGIFRRATSSRFAPESDARGAWSAQRGSAAKRTVSLVFTDGTAPFWATADAERFFAVAAAQGPVAVVQPLPEGMWGNTGLRPRHVRFRAASPRPGAPVRFWSESRRPQPIPGRAVPLLGLEGERIGPWAGLTGGRSLEFSGPAFLSPPLPQEAGDEIRTGTTASRRAHFLDDPLAAFAEIASPTAQLLACYLAVCGRIDLHVIRGVQAAALPESRSMHVAEVLLGGLLSVVEIDEGEAAERTRWVYPPVIRESLAARLPLELADWLCRHVTSLVEREAGRRSWTSAAAEPESGVFSAIRRQIKNRQSAMRVPEPVDDQAMIETEGVSGGDAAQELGRHRLIVEALAPGDPRLGPALLDLAEAELAGYRRSGRLEHLDEAVRALRRAVSPDGEQQHQSEPSLRLAEALTLRAGARGGHEAEAAREDAREAIQMYRTQLTQGEGEMSETQRARTLTGAVQAGSLAGTLTRERAAHDFAVRAARTQLAQAPPGHPRFAEYSAQLAEALGQRYSLSEAPADLNEALLHWQAATQQTSGPERVKYLLGRASALERRYDVLKALSDMTMAATCYQEASRAPGVGAEEQAVALACLARTLLATGRIKAAGEAARQALAIFERLGVVHRHPDALEARALLAGLSEQESGH